MDPAAAHLIVVDIHAKTNTTVDFLQNILYLVDAGHLVPGDILILDNASIHFAEEISDDLLTMLDESGVSLRFLPTYSPELNPCEIVFSKMKSQLRFWRGDDRFYMEILNAAASITYADMVAFYTNCLI